MKLRQQKEVVDLDLKPILSKRTPVFTLEDDQCPYLRVVDFAKVKQNTTAGNNRPEGYSSIVAIFGIVLSAYCTVDIIPGYDGR